MEVAIIGDDVLVAVRKVIDELHLYKKDIVGEYRLEREIEKKGIRLDSAGWLEFRAMIPIPDSKLIPVDDIERILRELNSSRRTAEYTNGPDDSPVQDLYDYKKSETPGRRHFHRAYSSSLDESLRLREGGQTVQMVQRESGDTSEDSLRRFEKNLSESCTFNIRQFKHIAKKGDLTSARRIFAIPFQRCLVDCGIDVNTRDARAYILSLQKDGLDLDSFCERVAEMRDMKSAQSADAMSASPATPPPIRQLLPWSHNYDSFTKLKSKNYVE